MMSARAPCQWPALQLERCGHCPHSDTGEQGARLHEVAAGAVAHEAEQPPAVQALQAQGGAPLRCLAACVVVLLASRLRSARAQDARNQRLERLPAGPRQLRYSKYHKKIKIMLRYNSRTFCMHHAARQQTPQRPS